MLTKHVFALLSLGGSLRAERIFPSPYHYRVRADAFEVVELVEDDVIALLHEKRIAAPPTSQVSDSYAYAVTDPVWFRDRALDGYTTGIGRCPVCDAFPLALTPKGLAPRHGFTKATQIPCEGSGKAPVSVLSRAPLQAAA